MRRERKIIHCFMLLSCLMAAVFFAGITAGASDAKKQSKAKVRKVVAKVNGEPIYEYQLDPGVEKDLKKFKKYGMRKDSSDLTNRLKKRALDKVIAQELFNQASRKLIIKDLDAKIEQKLQTMRNRYRSEGQFENSLKVKKLTMKGLRESLRKSVYVDEYLKNQGISETEVPEEHIKSFYARNPDSYYREETVKVSHILIKMDKDSGPEEKEEARKKAEQIRKEIIGGKDFTEMAKKYSDCNSASGGGDLKYIQKGYMPEEFDKAAFALENNAVSDVVETKFGYHIIKVFKKTPEGITPYQDVRNFIKKFLQERESKKKLDAHITELKQKAKIEILLNES